MANNLQTLKNELQKISQEALYNLSLEGFGFPVALGASAEVPFTAMPSIVGSSNLSSPIWMATARREIGISEIIGGGDSPRVGEYLKTAGQAPEDEIPWCSAYVNWVLLHSGIEPTRNAMARSWLSWGVPCSPVYGAITVLSRGSSNTQGHVGFLVKNSGDYIDLLGGNQSNQVKIQKYPTSRVLGYRWPK